MNKYLLDTNICIHYLKGQYNLQEKISEVGLGACFLSEITIAELLYGVENSAEAQRKKNLENLSQLRASFVGRTLLIGDSFYEYARQKAALKRMGRIVGEFDLLIGTTAIVHGLTLVTRNTKDFQNLDPIQLENWIDP
ncbi:MAG: type II toxin-antitoxin system VapC family toxin [Spirosomataceae bacterium]